MSHGFISLCMHFKREKSLCMDAAEKQILLSLSVSFSVSSPSTCLWMSLSDGVYFAFKSRKSKGRNRNADDAPSVFR